MSPKDILCELVCGFFAQKHLNDWKAWLTYEVTEKIHVLRLAKGTQLENLQTQRLLGSIQSHLQDNQELKIVVGGCAADPLKLRDVEFLFLGDRRVRFCFMSDVVLTVYDMLSIIQTEMKGYELVHHKLAMEIIIQIEAMKGNRLRFLVLDGSQWYVSLMTYPSWLACISEPKSSWQDPDEFLTPYFAKDICPMIWDFLTPPETSVLSITNGAKQAEQVVVCPFIHIENWNSPLQPAVIDLSFPRPVAQFTVPLTSSPAIEGNPYRERIASSAAQSVRVRHAPYPDLEYKTESTFANTLLFNHFAFLIREFGEYWDDMVFPPGKERLLTTDVQFMGEIIWKRKSANYVTEKEWWQLLIKELLQWEWTPSRDNVQSLRTFIQTFLHKEFELQTNLKEMKCVIGLIYNQQTSQCTCPIEKKCDEIHQFAAEYVTTGWRLSPEKLVYGKRVIPIRKEAPLPVVYLKSDRFSPPPIHDAQPTHDEPRIASARYAFCFFVCSQRCKKQTRLFFRPAIRQELLDEILGFLDWGCKDVKQQTRLLIIGRPGSGKTFLLKSVVSGRQDAGFINCMAGTIGSGPWPKILVLDEVDQCRTTVFPGVRVLIGISNNDVRSFRADKTIRVPMFSVANCTAMIEGNLSPKKKKWAAMSCAKRGADARQLPQLADPFFEDDRGRRMEMDADGVVGLEIDPMVRQLPEQQLVSMLAVFVIANGQNDRAPKKRRKNTNQKSEYKANLTRIVEVHKRLLGEEVGTCHGFEQMELQTCAENLQGAGLIDICTFCCNVPFKDIGWLLQKSVYKFIFLRVERLLTRT
jgi:hypothetical protein